MSISRRNGINKNDILLGTAILFAVWFMVGGIFWIY